MKIELSPRQIEILHVYLSGAETASEKEWHKLEHVIEKAYLNSHPGEASLTYHPEN